jgi:hypothetical protein
MPWRLSTPWQTPFYCGAWKYDAWAPGAIAASPATLATATAAEILLFRLMMRATPLTLDACAPGT